MPMSHDQIVREVLGRMADESPPAYEFDELTSVVVARRSPARPSIRRRYVAMLGGVALAAILGFGALQFVPDATPTISSRSDVLGDTPSSHDIDDVVIADRREDVSYVVGISEGSAVCARVSIHERGGEQSMGACGIGDDLHAMAMRGERRVAVAGFVSTSVGEMFAVLDDGERVPVELTPIPGRELVAFGLIHETQTTFVALELRDHSGELMQLHVPSIGPISQE